MDRIKDITAFATFITVAFVLPLGIFVPLIAAIIAH